MFKGDSKILRLLIALVFIQVIAELGVAIYLRLAYGDRMDLDTSLFGLLLLAIAVDRIRRTLAMQSAEIAALREANERHS